MDVRVYDPGSSDPQIAQEMTIALLEARRVHGRDRTYGEQIAAAVAWAAEDPLRLGSLIDRCVEMANEAVLTAAWCRFELSERDTES